MTQIRGETCPPKKYLDVGQYYENFSYAKNKSFEIASVQTDNKKIKLSILIVYQVSKKVFILV